MVDINLQAGLHRYNRYFVDLSNFYKTRKARVYTGIIAALVTIIFFIAFAIKPTLVTIAGLIKQVKDQQFVLTSLEGKIRNLSTAQTNYLNNESKIYLVDEALPASAEIGSLAKQLEALSRKTEVSIESFRINEAVLDSAEEKIANEKQPVNFNVTVSGNYENLRKFINLLSNLRRTISIESFVFQSGRDQSGILALNINGQVWFLPK